LSDKYLVVEQTFALFYSAQSAFLVHLFNCIYL